MDGAANLTANNVTVASGRAELEWANTSRTWTTGAAFAAAGNLSRGMTANASGLGLWQNWSNSVFDGNFASRGRWVYVNSTSRHVTAEWNRSIESAELNSSSPSTQRLWDSMNSTANWTWAADVGPVGSPSPQRAVQYQGMGSVGIDIVSWLTGQWVALQRLGTSVNWSAYDRLIVAVKMNTSLTVSMSVNATVGLGGPSRETTPEPLMQNWNEYVIDLDQLGTSVERGNLQNVQLRLRAHSVPSNTWFYVADARLGKAKVFNDAAFVTELFVKDNATSPLNGSAILSFDWCLASRFGVASVVASVNVTRQDPPFYQAALPLRVSPAWSRFRADISKAMAAAGAYNVTFRLSVAANNTTASGVAVYIDNVSIVIPDPQNGTYLSSPLSFGADSQYLTANWSATLPTSTSAKLAVRAGNSSNLGSAGWQSLSTPGNSSLSVAGALYYQIQARLNTTNASITPTLRALTLTARHRVAGGFITSDMFHAGSDFLRWRSFNASVVVPSGSSASFMVRNTGPWTNVTRDANLSFLEGPSIRWRAVLNTTDGLVTPLIIRIQIVYEFLGPVVRLAISPSSPIELVSGSSIHFTATAYDAGSHVVALAPSLIAWSTDDPTGHIYNNGTYVAGGQGVYNVTATVVGTGIHQSVRVVVTDANPGWNLLLISLLAVLAAVLGIGGYRLAAARLYAVDDVFLIAKDGRLIMHNTRRMRADRDEDILSAMLTAIMAFLRDQDPEENGELKRFEVGGKTTLLERGEHAYLTVVYSGRVPGWAGKDLRRFMADLENRFGAAFATWDGSPEDLQGLKEYMKRFVSHVRYHAEGRFRGTPT